MLKLRHEAGDGAEHFQVYSGAVRVGTIYRTHQHPGGNEWMWFLNGVTFPQIWGDVQNGPGPFNGFVQTFEDAKAEFAASWGAWRKAAGLSEDAPTAQAQGLGFRARLTYNFE